MPTIARAPQTGGHPHGLVSPLTDVERWWYRDVVAGLSYDWTDGDADGEFHLQGAAMADLLDAYDAECARAQGHRGPAHMLVETARHLGHIDLLREQVDGATGDLPVDSRR